MIRLLLPILLLVPVAAAQELDTLRARQVVLRAAMQQVLPSVVRIDTIGGAERKRDPQRPTFRQADGPTTGLIVAADGWILTSSFNFVRDPQVITVRLPDKRRLVAKLVARDEVAKLTLLKVDASDLPVPVFADLDAVRPGQTSFAAGFGHGSETPSLAVGIVSALRRMDGIAIQTDARISPASYGGPLCDLQGRVLGICVPLATNGDELAGAQWYDSGIAFAIRPDFFQPRLARLQAGDTLQRGLLGVFLDDAHPVEGDDAGVGRLLTAEPAGPARKAGLAEGDRIVAVNGKPCPTPIALRRLLIRIPAGDTCEVRYLRDGEERTCELTLASTGELLAEAEAEAEAAREQAEEEADESKSEG